MKSLQLKNMLKIAGFYRQMLMQLYKSIVCFCCALTNIAQNESPYGPQKIKLKS